MWSNATQVITLFPNVPFPLASQTDFVSFMFYNIAGTKLVLHSTCVMFEFLHICINTCTTECKPATDVKSLLITNNVQPPISI